MKKTSIFILLFIICNICNAQNPILPPNDNNEGMSQLHQFIQNYQTQQSADKFIPYSYIINTDDIKYYFNHHNPDTNCYFHVYFATDPKNITRIVLVPSITLADGLDTILEHHLLDNYDSVFVPCLHQNPDLVDVNSAFFVYNPDGFDASITQGPTPCPCFSKDIGFSPIQPIYCGMMNKSAVKPWIDTYQTHHSNENQDAPTYTQSFTFCANLLRRFLTDTTNDVPLLQIYIGIDPNAEVTGNKQKRYTLVFIGMDMSGNHIPVTNWIGVGTAAYEACRPCPKCGVQFDQAIDKQSQLFTNLDEKYNNFIKDGKRPTPIIAGHYKKQRYCKTKVHKVTRMQKKYLHKHGKKCRHH